MFAHTRDGNPGTILASLQLVQILLSGGAQETCAWGMELNSYATCEDEVQLVQIRGRTQYNIICYATCVDEEWNQ